jgi:hypothetical protein
MLQGLLRVCVICLFISPTLAGDYVLSIDGKDQELALDLPLDVTLPSGAKAKLVLRKKAFGSFSGEGISFEHPGNVSVTSTAIDTDSKQFMAATAIGTLVLVQKHGTTNPTSLLNAVYDSLVDEPKAMGLKINREDITRTTANGVTLTGYRATYAGGNDDVTLDVVTTGSKAGGYVVVSLHDKYTAPEEKPFVDRFWASLKLE